MRSEERTQNYTYFWSNHYFFIGFCRHRNRPPKKLLKSKTNVNSSTFESILKKILDLGGRSLLGKVIFNEKLNISKITKRR